MPYLLIPLLTGEHLHIKFMVSEHSNKEKETLTSNHFRTPMKKLQQPLFE